MSEDPAGRSAVPPRRRADLIVRVLRGEMTLAEAAASAGVGVREIERWQQRFLSAGRRALDLDVVPARRSAGPSVATEVAHVAAPGTAAGAHEEDGDLGGAPQQGVEPPVSHEVLVAKHATVEEWLRLLPAQVQGVSWTTDAELRFTSVGRVGADAEPPLRFVGMTLYDFFRTQDSGFSPIANHLLALQGQAGSYEHCFLGRTFQYRLEALRDAGGRIAGVVGTALDVTERRRSEEALREQQDRLTFLIEQLPAILWTMDENLVITSSVGAGLTGLGLAPNELVGRSLQEYLGTDDPDGSLTRGHRAALRGESVVHQGQWSGHDYETHYEPLRNADDEVVGIIGLTVDISDRRQVEREREELLAREKLAREQAEAASRLKDEFLATISHELRTPLNAILGWAHLLREEDLDEETRARAIETIERNSRSQARLIQDLLDVSHIVTGRTRLDIRAVEDLAEIVAAVAESLRPAAIAKRIELYQVFDPDAGPILGDPERLQQIVWNLVSNAIKFTPQGGRVHVSLTRVQGRVQIKVSDTGEGIAPEFLPYVFDRFSQADASAARRHAGLGLGLAIVRHLVELQGGEAAVDSAGEGQGATFTVSLPVLPVRAEPQPRPPAGAHEDDPSAKASLEGLRVMAVDDEPDTLEMIRVVLERCRANVHTATSAAEGLRQLESWKPDVLIADIGMPLHDGYWLIRRVRDLAPERGGRVPAVALTAFARAEDRLRTLSAGYQTHVAKPVEPAELVAVISSLSRLRAR